MTDPTIHEPAGEPQGEKCSPVKITHANHQDIKRRLEKYLLTAELIPIELHRAELKNASADGTGTEPAEDAVRAEFERLHSEKYPQRQSGYDYEFFVDGNNRLTDIYCNADVQRRWEGYKLACERSRN